MSPAVEGRGPEPAQGPRGDGRISPTLAPPRLAPLPSRAAARDGRPLGEVGPRGWEVGSRITPLGGGGGGVDGGTPPGGAPPGREAPLAPSGAAARVAPPAPSGALAPPASSVAPPESSVAPPAPGRFDAVARLFGAVAGLAGGALWIGTNQPTVAWAGTK